MKKSKKDRKSGEIAAEQDKGEPIAGSSEKNANEEDTVYMSPIAQPMASSKVTKKIRKLIKAGMLMKRYKSPGIDKIPAELIKAGGSKICSEIHKLIMSIWNKEELPDQWKESVAVPVYKKGDKTDCSNYRGISFLSITYKILSNILLSRLTRYAE
jgi:hypothetical protein